MSERFSTAGMWIGWAAESTKDTRPTSGYTKIPEVKSMPSFNPAPDTIESTTLEETEYRTYVKGLKDLGGALEYSANLTDDLMDAWDDLLDAFEDAVENEMHIWFVVVHPYLKNAVYFTGDPSTIGLNEASVGGMAETTLYITPTGAPIMDAKPSDVDSP